jgi:hypothetical protein
VLSLRGSDVHFVEVADFSEEPGVHPAYQQHAYTETEIMFFVEQTKVMEMLHVIHCDNFSRFRLQKTTIGFIADRRRGVQFYRPRPGVRGPSDQSADDYMDRSIILLREWYDNVPEAVRYQVDDVQGHRFWPAFLHILYLFVATQSY